MGTGYTRNDASNNIADGNVINASDLDGEFDAVESAFGTSGHTHDGTAAEGGAITKVGPVQDIVVSATNVNPKTNNAIDLGTASLKYKDAHFQGSIDTDGVITAATFEPDGDTAAGDNAAIGYTAAEGLILTGQGSTSDITLKNDADAVVFTVPTGTDDILFPDNAKAMFGAGSDLQIYHDGSHSYVTDQGTGRLYLQGTSNVTLTNADGTAEYANFANGGAASLRYNNSVKLATADTGVTITGNAAFADNGKAIFGAGSDLQIYHDGSNSYIEDTATGDLILKSNGSSIAFQKGDGSELFAVSTSGGFTATDGSTITTADNSDQLTLISTDTDANAGPNFVLFRNPGQAGADSDVLGTIKFEGLNDAGSPETIVYGQITSSIVDASDGTEDGLLKIETILAGTSRDRITMNSTETIFNDGSQDLDFRVESNGNANMLFVDGGNDRIGVGTNAPTSELSVVGTGTFTKTNNAANIILKTTDTDANEGPVLKLSRDVVGAADDVIGTVQYYGQDVAGNDTHYVELETIIKDATDGSEDGRFNLTVAKAGVLVGVLNADMSLGEVVINEGSKDINFRVESDNDTHAFFINGADGNIGMSISDPASHIPVSHNTGKRSFVIHEASGPQFVASRADTTVAAGNYIGGYLFKTNDVSADKFGGMIATGDDSSGNGNLEFYPVSNSYESSNEGSMQLDDSGDLYVRGGGIRVGRSHGNVYTTAEESVIIYSGGVSNTGVRITGRSNAGGGDSVFLHEILGSTKSEIEENGDFLSATDSYGAVSDGRLKENIVDSGSQWDDIKALQIKKYSFIEDGLDAPDKIGVIAQDLLASNMNGLVKQKFKTDVEDNPILDADGNHDYIYTVKSSVMQMKALKALQEAMAKIEVLETKVAALEAE